MRTKLSDGPLSIEVDSHGAELCSIKFGGREYLWQADPAFWGRHSPVLFPIVGRVWDNVYRVDGQEYSLPQHGFARDMEFELTSKTDSEIWFCLEDSPETLQKYPFRFRLEIGYRVQGAKVDVMWRVSNPGGEDLLFQIGAHPAFYFPDYDPVTAERGYFLLSGYAPGLGTPASEAEGASHGTGNAAREAGDAGHDVEDARRDTNGAASDAGDAGRHLEYILVKEKGCADTATRYPLQLQDGYLPLDTHTFDKDALIFDHSQVNKVTLCRRDKTPWLSLSFDAPLVGLWSPPGKNAPFVCIEPWYGRCDRAGFCGEFRDKDWMNSLAPGGTFSSVYTIEIATEA